MKWLRGVTLFVWTTQVAFAGEGLPEEYGAHWARVSDKAQVELLVDQVTTAASGRGDEWVVRKHVAPGFDLAAPVRPTVPGFLHAEADHVSVSAERSVVRLKEGGELVLVKHQSRWMLTAGSVVPSAITAPQSSMRSVAAGVSVGETFKATPISEEYDIDRLTRGVTRSRLQRDLFGTADKTASYYFAHYTSSAPFVTALYVQLVLDREWNRILFGNLHNGIKAYTAILGPSCIATDSEGRVFVGETGNQRISVLKLIGEGNDVQLIPQYVISGISEPTDIALSDNATPLDTSDDLLYIADGSKNQILKYALGPAGATLAGTFPGFDSPTAILDGKWNGGSSGVLYVIDNVGKRLRAFEDDGAALLPVAEMMADHKQYFQCMKADHFGNLYVVDNVHSHLLKFTASLEFLDGEQAGDAYSALGNIDIPFGKIIVDGEGTYWAGFDQLFAIERWSENSGAQRRTLGLSLRNLEFSSQLDLSAVTSSFLLTDFGDVAVRIYDNDNRLVRALHTAWMVSGSKALVWDRRDDDGRQVAPGTYRYEIAATSAYRDEATVSQTRLYLPMYYWQDCGSSNVEDDAMLVQGSVVSWGAEPWQTANEHAASVQYRFTGLNPASEYEVAAEYAASDEISRLQDLTVNGIEVLEAIAVSGTPQTTKFVKLPKEAYANGEVIVSVNRRGEGTAIASQLWMRETGIGFSVEQLSDIVPTAYALEQNYPNPFNPATVIRYALPQDGQVSLKVYDITGREVATLVNEHKPAGTYEARFDIGSATGGKNLASGVYFYRVKAAGFTETKKMVLLK